MPLGALVAQNDHDPHGRLIRETGPKAASCPFRYSTKYRDPDLELYHYGYRWYDAAAVKWLTPDPIGERGGANLTAFCSVDPINQVDPLGLAPGDGGGNPITLGPGFDFYPVGGWSGGLWEFEHRAVSGLQVSSYALYAVTVKPAFGVVQWIEEHPRVSGAIRAVGGVGQLVLGGTMLYGTGGGGALVGGGTLVANGLDNFVAGAATVVHGEYRRSLLEHGIHCGVEAVGGPEWVGVVLYSGAQVGLPYAAARLSAVQNASKSASAAVLPNTGNRTAQAPTIHGAGALRSALASSGDDVARGGSRAPVLGDTALKGVGDDMLVHFSQLENRASIVASGITTEGVSCFYRVGDIKHLTPAQVRCAIGPLARGGTDNSLAIVVSPHAAPFFKVQQGLVEYVTMQNKVPWVLIRTVPGGQP